MTQSQDRAKGLRYRAAAFGLACCIVCPFALAQAGGDPSKQQCSAAVVKLVGNHFSVRDLSFPRRDLYPSKESGGLVVSAACKAWPDDKSRTIAAIAYDAGVEHEKRLLVAMVVPVSGAVLAAYSGPIQEDAAMTVGENSLGVDTGRYHLAPGVRAFGVDLSSSYSQGCVEGGIGPMQTLFIQEGKTLRPVLEGFYLSTWRYAKNVASCSEAAQDAITETIYYEIGIGKTASKGFADLRITATSSYSDGAKSRRKPLSYELKYDGKAYPTETFNGAGDRLDKWTDGH